MTSPATSSSHLYTVPIPRKKRPLSTSTNSSPSTHSSIYDAGPCSSGSPSPTPSLHKPNHMFNSRPPSSYLQNMDPANVSSPLPTIREQKSAALSFTKSPSSISSSLASSPLLGDPYASSVEDDFASPEFISSLERYYGSPTAPLLPSKEPPPQLPPLPDNIAMLPNARLLPNNGRQWRPLPSGHRSYGTLGGHPFHHAPIAEVGGAADGGRAGGDSDDDGITWKALFTLICCFGCMRALMFDDDDED